VLLAPASSPRAEHAADTRPGAPRLPQALDGLVRTYPKPVADALKGLEQGVQKYFAGAYGAALAALPADGAATAVPDLFLLYRAKANLALDHPDEALLGFRALKTKYPASPQLSESILGEAQAQLRLRDAAAALAVLAHPALEENAETLYYRGRAQEDSGNGAAARALYLRVYSQFAASKTAALAEQRLLGLQPGFASDPANYDALLARADAFLLAGKNADARASLARLPAARSAADAEQRDVLIAEAECNLGRATLALRLISKIGPTNPERHARALYLQAVAHRKLDQEAEFLADRDRALELHPTSPFTEKLLYSVATYFDVNNRPEEARAAYAAIASNFPKGVYAERARWKVALQAFVDRRYDEALRAFWNCVFANPDSAARASALYWMGRSAEKLGDAGHAGYFYSRARSLANHSYYGQVALEAEKRLKPGGRATAAAFDFDAARRVIEGLRLASPDMSSASAEAVREIERARQLASAGLPEVALAELRWARDHMADKGALSFVMSRIYELKDDFYGVIVSLRRAFPDYGEQPPNAFPEEVWRLLFPVRHWDTITANARKYRVDPALVIALIRQESAFQEDARSRANARGLMQVLPKTGKQLAPKAGVTRYTTAKLYRPEANIALGTRHLFTLLERYDGKTELALAAYNAGETRVDRWLKEFGDVDMAQFVERIPFAETRGYVKQVLTNRGHYRWLTAGGTAP
jgi:soluble lytic murein transglycosylase